jgi:hypothetical protein
MHGIYSSVDNDTTDYESTDNKSQTVLWTYLNMWDPTAFSQVRVETLQVIIKMPPRPRRFTLLQACGAGMLADLPGASANSAAAKVYLLDQSGAKVNLDGARTGQRGVAIFLGGGMKSCKFAVW